MPIVPGVLITNAIQDLFGGHMLMFTTKIFRSFSYCLWYRRWCKFNINFSLGVLYMFWIFNFIFSFLAFHFFCVIFDAPRKLYFACGFVGACGWMVYTVLFNGFELHTIYSSFSEV